MHAQDHTPTQQWGVSSAWRSAGVSANAGTDRLGRERSVVPFLVDQRGGAPAAGHVDGPRGDGHRRRPEDARVGERQPGRPEALDMHLARRQRVGAAVKVEPPVAAPIRRR